MVFTSGVRKTEQRQKMGWKRSDSVRKLKKPDSGLKRGTGTSRGINYCGKPHVEES